MTVTLRSADGLKIRSLSVAAMTIGGDTPDPGEDRFSFGTRICDGSSATPSGASINLHVVAALPLFATNTRIVSIFDAATVCMSVTVLAEGSVCVKTGVSGI